MPELDQEMDDGPMAAVSFSTVLQNGDRGRRAWIPRRIPRLTFDQVRNCRARPRWRPAKITHGAARDVATQRSAIRPQCTTPAGDAGNRVRVRIQSVVGRCWWRTCLRSRRGSTPCASLAPIGTPAHPQPRRHRCGETPLVGACPKAHGADRQVAALNGQLWHDSAVRVRESSGSIVQAAAAAGVAWLIADSLFPNQQAVFAPFSAIVALVGSRGGRGKRAVRMLFGVAVGVALGELTVATLGHGAWQIAATAGVAMLLVSPLIIDPLALTHSGVAAAIVVATGSQTGYIRFVDALIGAVIALLMTQVLFSPRPVPLLSRTATDVLGPIAVALREIGGGLAGRDPEPLRAAVAGLQDAHQPLATFIETRGLSRNIARRTLRGRRQAGRLACLDGRLDGLVALYTSTAALARLAERSVERDLPLPERLSGVVAALADGADVLVDDPENRAAQADSSIAEIAELTDDGTQDRVTLLVETVREVGRDLAQVAGADIG